MQPIWMQRHYARIYTCVRIVRNKERNKTMAQETLNGLLQYVIQTLSTEDKQWFARQLVDDAFEAEQVKPYTWDEARERLATAREQFRQGQYLTHDEVIHSQMRAAV